MRQEFSKAKAICYPGFYGPRHDPVNAGVAVATPTCYMWLLPADEASLPAHGAPGELINKRLNRG